MSLPHWLRRHLESRGLWNADGISRAARARQCRHCHRLILAGLDADRAAWPALVDPTPLDPLGEALALLNHQATYDIYWTGARLELELRDAATIRTFPPGKRPNADVLAAHRCQAPKYPSLPSAHERPAALSCDGPPPF